MLQETQLIRISFIVFVEDNKMIEMIYYYHLVFSPGVLILHLIFLNALT